MPSPPSTQTVTVNALIDERPLGRLQIEIIILSGLVIVLDGFDTQCIGLLAPAIAEDLTIPLREFGSVFSAGLLGLMVGAMAAGPIADRWGRKWLIVISALIFGAFTVLTASAQAINQLVTLRFLTGLGLGGALPNVVALTSEYTPKRLQLSLVAALFCGMPLGALIGGLTSAAMISTWGWQSVLYVGGLLPLLLAPVLIMRLPESARFLAIRQPAGPKMIAVLDKIAPDRPAGVALRAEEAPHRGLPLKHLFTEGRAAGTVLLLWIPCFMNLLILYFIVNWLPGLLRQSGMPVSAGIWAVSLFSLGGITGSLLQGRFVRGRHVHVGLMTEFAVSAGLIALLAYSAGSLGWLLTVAFVLGVSVQGAQAGLNGVSAIYYPTDIRATGVGWTNGIGRIGSIVGPALGGLLLTLAWTPQRILLAATVPALFAAMAVVGNRAAGGWAGQNQVADEPAA